MQTVVHQAIHRRNRHVHPRVAGGIIDVYRTVVIGYPSVREKHIGHIAHPFPRQRSQQIAGWFSYDAPRFIGCGHIQIEHIAQSGGTSAYSVRQVQPPLGGADGVRSLSVLHLFDRVIITVVYYHFVLHLRPGDVVYQRPSYSSPISGINKIILRTGSVARNEESFSFLYAEHLDILRRMGTVTFFNPEQDRAVPQETDLLYLPGGYPENRLEELAGARLARESIRSYIEAGGRTLAECGGMIYLSQSVLSDGDMDGGSFDTDGRIAGDGGRSSGSDGRNAGSSVGNIRNEMVGVLPFSVTNERKRRKLTLGYRRFDYNGWRLKGHEFHYTQFAVPETDGKEGGACSLPPSIAQVYNAKGEKVTTPVFRYKNLIASYTHLYWGEVDVMALFGEL